jgi:hypothetical protein
MEAIAKRYLHRPRPCTGALRSDIKFLLATIYRWRPAEEVVERPAKGLYIWGAALTTGELL